VFDKGRVVDDLGWGLVASVCIQPPVRVHYVHYKNTNPRQTDDGESPRGIWEENACMMAIPEGLMEFAFRGHFRDYKRVSLIVMKI
jgi:hypothetical protein